MNEKKSGRKKCGSVKAGQMNFSELRDSKMISRNDLLLIIGICLAAVLLLFFYWFSDTRASRPMLEILVQNERFGVYSLQEDQVIEINDTNRCEISNGTVTMIWADCPDELCMHQTAIDANGGYIICLPNQVVLHIIDADSSGENQVDSVAG